MITTSELALLKRIGAIQVPNMPRASWSIGTRKATRNFTVHYNGPEVKAVGNIRAELDQMRSDARYHMRKGAFGVANGADGLQYHGGTLSDGSNWRFRDLQDELWHCGNYEGNTFGISWHLPIGKGQSPTSKQLQSLYAVFAAVREIYNISVVNIVGHLEWKATDCPGLIMPYIRQYRAQAIIPTPTIWYRTLYNANVREAPDTNAPIALHGAAVTPAGTTFAIDKIIEDGVPYYGNPVYVHRADGLGFYHMSVVTPANDVNFVIGH